MKLPILRTFTELSGISKATVLLAVLWSLLLAVLIALSVQKDVRREQQRTFLFRSAELVTAIDARMNAYQATLRGAASSVASFWPVTRSQWHEYIDDLELDKNYPGAQGVGFAPVVTLHDAARITRLAQQEGLKDFRIFPQGERPIYFPILWIEPFAGRNLRAPGFDMFAEPVRRQAMERARDSGDPVVSGKVRLVQETGANPQQGFLMYVPVYQQGVDLESVEARRQALYGFVFSPFRAGDLVGAVLGHAPQDLRLQLFDGTEIAPASLLYDSRLGDTQADQRKPEFETIQHIRFNGHAWTMRLQSLPPFEAALERRKPVMVLLFGLAIGGLFTGLVWSLLLNHHRLQRAQSYADRLADSEQQSRAVLENSLDAFVAADAEQRVIDWNPQAQNIFGWRREEVLGKPLADVVAAAQDDMQHFMQRGAQALRGTRGEMVARRRDGGQVPVEIAMVPINLKNRWIFSGSLRDISERKLAEQRIRALHDELESRVVERTAQLQEANRDLEAFTYTVSHDLRSPLRAIAGFTRIVLEDFARELPAEAVRYLNLVGDNAKRMAQLLDDLLAFSRLGRQPVARHPVDMKQLAIEAADEVRHGLTLPDERIVIDDLPGAAGDRALLRQVFINLLSNAVKFSRSVEAARIHVGYMDHGSEMVYFVRDNGVGFDMQYVDKLFGVFQRLHSQDEYEGTGAGLAIVKRVIDRHGGRVWAESGPGGGATFYFTLGPAPDGAPAG